MIWVKAALITGAIIASPWIFWQVWSFVAAGLYPHEKNYVYFFLPVSLGLFFAGAALAFFYVFEPVLDFLFGFNRMMNIDPDPRISEWMSFVLMLPLGFGISFQLPLVMLILERIGILIGRRLPGQVADCRAGDLRDQHAADPRRPDQHAADGLPADRPLLWRHPALQIPAEASQSVR